MLPMNHKDPSCYPNGSKLLIVLLLFLNAILLLLLSQTNIVSPRFQLFDDLLTLPLRAETIPIHLSTAELTTSTPLKQMTTKQYKLPKIVFTAVWRDKKGFAMENIPKFIALAKQIT